MIAEDQNTPVQLQRLAAQRRMYSEAKAIFALQTILSVPLTLSLALAAVALSTWKPAVALIGVVLALSDVFWLNPWQRRLRETAAKIQERFDCDVLQLPWNQIKAGGEVEPEVVKEWSDKYQESDDVPLKDWYACEVDSLPLPIGRMICQRTNCWWDAKQRRVYAAVILGVTATVSIIVFLAALEGGLTLAEFVLGVAAPLAPAVVMAFRQVSEQRDAATRLDNLRSHVEMAWQRVFQNHQGGDVAVDARALQDEIFEHRKRSPLVFDWIFKLLRGRFNEQMVYGAAAYVAEARKRLATSV